MSQRRQYLLLITKHNERINLTLQCVLIVVVKQIVAVKMPKEFTKATDRVIENLGRVWHWIVEKELPWEAQPCTPSTGWLWSTHVPSRAAVLYRCSCWTCECNSRTRRDWQTTVIKEERNAGSVGLCFGPIETNLQPHLVRWWSLWRQGIRGYQGKIQLWAT